MNPPIPQIGDFYQFYLHKTGQTVPGLFSVEKLPDNSAHPVVRFLIEKLGIPHGLVDQKQAKW